MVGSKLVGIWVRVSTELQVKDDSPEHHELRGRQYAEAKGWIVQEVYRLDAVSGKSVMEHPEAKRMLRDLRGGRITGLIFSKLARLARNTRELLEFSEIFRQQNADLISLTENIDTSSPAGRLLFTIISALSEWERNEIAERVAASVPVRAKLGKPLGGQAPYGYRWEGKELVIDENEAPVRRLMYELFAEHKRKTTVAQVLNDKGYRTRNGSMFSDTTVGRLLRDPMAKGERRANYTKSLGEGKRWTVKPASEWVIIPCPAIVTQDVWSESNRILDEQERRRTPPTKRPVHLFTGILRCECGAKMHIPSKSKKYVCLACRKNRIEAADLEEIYYEQLKTFLLTGDHIDAFLSKAGPTIRAKEDQLEKLVHEARKLRMQMDKLIELHMGGTLPKEAIAKHYNPLDEQLRQIEAGIPQLQGEIDYLKVESLNGDHMLQEAKTLYDYWPSLVFEGKRNIVEQITSGIVMGGDTISIKFNYNPSLLGISPDSQRNLRDSYSLPT